MDEYFNGPLFPLSFILMFFFITLYLLPKKAKRHFQLLKNHFQGNLSYPLGNLTFHHKGFHFNLIQIARTVVGYIPTGSYPVLWFYAQSSSKFIIGNKKSSHYTRGNFFFMPTFDTSEIGTTEILVGHQDAKMRKAILDLVSDPEVQPIMNDLFVKDFSHLSGAYEYHLHRFLFIRKRFVIRYVGLPYEIYSDPSLLESKLAILHSLFLLLKIRPCSE